MKFRDGMWVVAQDKRVEYAEDIYKVTNREDGKALNLLCPTRKIYSRGDTLNLSTLSIDIEAEIDGVISLEVTHWRGARRRGPNFELYPDGRPSNVGVIHDVKSGKTLQSGSLSATISPDPHTFAITFNGSDGREITSLQNRSVGLAYSPPFINSKATEDMRNLKHYVFTQTELGVGESIHGLGERFGAFNKVGQSIEIWNEDGGTSSEQAYKNIPFYLSSAGYGVFIDTPDRIDLEIGSERSCRLQTSVESQRLKWYLIYGPTPKEVLTRYSILIGKAPCLPPWSFGLWLTTSFTTSYDEQTVSSFLEQMTARSVPVEVFHFDCFWMDAFTWCDFVFSPTNFPDPKGQIVRMKSANLVNKTCCWINPYLAQATPVFDFAAKNNYLVKRQNGDIWQWDLWQTGMGLIDLTNPAAAAWYEECLTKLFDVGIDCLKTDFGERIPTTDVAWFDTSVDPSRMHNFYPFIYNKLCFRAMQARHGKDQAVLFARSATAGTQRFPLCWGGDCESTYAALAESIRGGLSIGLSGYSFWSNDIGGFEGSPPPGIYKRWVAFGLLCSHSRLHGSNSYRVPWAIDDGAEGEESCTGVLRKFTRLKRSLMPYLYAQAVESAGKGWPMSVRAMGLEFPEDETAWFCDRQFMLGDALLVAPIFCDEGSVRFYLPEGRWWSWWGDEEGREKVLEGPRWVGEKHGFTTLPLFVREGSVLLVGREEGEKGEGFGYDWIGQGGEVRVYGKGDGRECRVVDAKGKEVAVLGSAEEGEVKGLQSLGDKWVVKRFE